MLSLLSQGSPFKHGQNFPRKQLVKRIVRNLAPMYFPNICFSYRKFVDSKEKQVAEFLGRDLLGNSSTVNGYIYLPTEKFDSCRGV